MFAKVASTREPASLPSMDENRYRTEVLRLGDGETEEEAEEKLLAEARELGLKVPEIEIAASLAASISSSVLDSSSPLCASVARHSLERSSLSDCVTPGATSVDQLAHSFSETTISDNVPSSSLPSVDSLSTRFTSFSSSDGRPGHISPLKRNGSISSVAGSVRRKRASFINAIGKLPFRKRRSTSSVALPPSTHITVQRKEGNIDTVLIEAKAEIPDSAEPPQEQEILKVEVPLFDEAALQRSLDNPDLKEMYESHKMERLRLIAFQNEILDSLKQKHSVAIAEKKLDNERMETARREQNAAHVARMEERHLTIEMDQLKEFEREKRNSRTRIKYMEGYVNTCSPPQSPSSGSDSGVDLVHPTRKVTRRQREQLAQEYLDRDSMDRLHEARIKVLRDRQERQLQETISRLEKELESLIAKNAEAIAELEMDHQREEQAVLQAFDVKKARLKRRWNLEEAILRKRLEMRDGVPYGPLPSLSFSSLDPDVPTLKNPLADNRPSATAH
ncbi:hypothetical protein VTN77DRAFT_2248 [Rasamsonia byssochlamydoides]|uniref:uncharacterized protein n=1 Tax=Rasamsonia byssochlamydoides TaxID=89139 RepID=UPI0037433798